MNTVVLLTAGLLLLNASACKDDSVLLTKVNLLKDLESNLVCKNLSALNKCTSVAFFFFIVLAELYGAGR